MGWGNFHAATAAIPPIVNMSTVNLTSRRVGGPGKFLPETLSRVGDAWCGTIPFVGAVPSIEFGACVDVADFSVGIMN
jgi:hypothetical protein